MASEDDFTPPPWTPGDRAWKIRKLRKMQQAQVAERAGLNKNTISNVEQDKFPPDGRTLDRIADALDVPAWYIRNGQPY